MQELYTQLQEELSQFLNREHLLRGVRRYSNQKIMFYRTNLFAHSKRVTWNVMGNANIALKYFPDFNVGKAIAIAFVHDDAEIVTGDFQAGDRLKLSQSQSQNLDSHEERAIEELSVVFPKTLASFVYKDLLYEILYPQSIEAQFVKYMDKFEGYAEALHEVFGGNYLFALNYVSDYGEIVSPTKYYEDFFSVVNTKLPLLASIKEEENSLFEKKKDIGWYMIGRRSNPHTRESVFDKKGYEPYDAWLEGFKMYAGSEDTRMLYEQKEFHKI